MDRYAAERQEGTILAVRRYYKQGIKRILLLLITLTVNLYTMNEKIKEVLKTHKSGYQRTVTEYDALRIAKWAAAEAISGVKPVQTESGEAALDLNAYVAWDLSLENAIRETKHKLEKSKGHKLP